MAWGFEGVATATGDAAMELHPLFAELVGAGGLSLDGATYAYSNASEDSGLGRERTLAACVTAAGLSDGGVFGVESRSGETQYDAVALLEGRWTVERSGGGAEGNVTLEGQAGERVLVGATFSAAATIQVWQVGEAYGGAEAVAAAVEENATVGEYAAGSWRAVFGISAVRNGTSTWACSERGGCFDGAVHSAFVFGRELTQGQLAALHKSQCRRAGEKPKG